jgi:dTDP-glucose 4,6-dehydratase
MEFTGYEVNPVNIGNPDEVTMLQLAKEILEITASKSKIVFQPLPEDDPKVRQPDITRAKSLLRWEPKVNRREGLLKTLEYFKKKIFSEQKS